MIPEIDSKIGISLYTTKFSGIGGKIRIYPEDFEVSELISKRATNSITNEGGYAPVSYTHLTLPTTPYV